MPDRGRQGRQCAGLPYLSRERTTGMATAHRRYFQIALDAIEQFDRASTIGHLSEQLLRAISAFGYQFACCVSAPGFQSRPFQDRILLNNWPKPGREQYHSSNFHSHDPIAISIRGRSEAFRWADVSIPSGDRIAQEVMAISANQYRMRHGFCVPILGLSGYQAGMSFAGFDIEDVAEADASVQLIGIYAFNRLANLKSTLAPRILTDREREVLQWAAAGKTASDTGIILDI